jgi:diguanylate cyclase (GGDEF)-like protein
MPSRLHAVVTATVLAAVAVATVAAQRAVDQPITLRQLVLLTVAVPASEMALLHVRVVGDRWSFTWGEACLMVGFSLVSPAWFVMVSGPLVMGVHLCGRRGLMKSAFNGASFAVSAGAAYGVLTVLASPPYLASRWSTAAALVLAVTTYSLVSALLTAGVVALASGRTLVQVLRDSAPIALVVWAGNASCAIVLLILAEHVRGVLWALPPVMVTALVAYRAYLSAEQDRDAWQQLEAAGRELNLLDEAAVAEAAIRRAGQLFSSGDVTLALRARAGHVDRTSAVVDDALVVAAADAIGPLVPFVELDTMGRRAEPATVVSAALTGATGTLGSMRLGFDKPVRLSRRERRVLATFANTVGASLLNAHLYEEARSEAERQAYDASHDPLTGLANRSLLNSVTTQAMATGDGVTALLLLDLDHFKEINDTLGHAAGDLVLVEVARRLRRAVRGGDLVARLGGDEFAVLLTGLSDPDQAEPVASQLLAALTAPIEYEGLHLSIDGSIGVACHPHDAGDAEELFRRCDVAMYQAKLERGAWLRYDPLRDDSSVQRLALVGELRTAIADQLVVHFQPQVDLATGAIIGAEALVRWQHPERGLLQPSDFVGVAEQSGLVRPFTLRVLELAVEECVQWQRPGRSVSVAVNLGARVLLDRHLPNDIAAILSKHGLPPQCLVLEITETTAASELEVVEEVLGQLRRLGVEISVDDFGTGYSSLAFLQRTAVHELKVDRSFVSGMLVNDNDLALVRATVHLAHSLGARAVAEGVESQALQVALQSMGCDIAQGYHLGRPMPAAQLRTVLAGHLAGIPVPRADGDRHLHVIPGASA